MSCFAQCFWYLIFISIIAFPIGRLLPKKWFCPDRFPYRSFSFEKSGRIYDALNIRRWQNKLPDMSRIFPKWIPQKDLKGDYVSRLPRMVQETCVAEFIHTLLCVTGLHCLTLYPGGGGVMIVILYVVVFNLPFILIQRYNRPKLMRLLNRRVSQIQTKEALANVCADTKL